MTTNGSLNMTNNGATQICSVCLFVRENKGWTFGALNVDFTHGDAYSSPVMLSGTGSPSVSAPSSNERMAVFLLMVVHDESVFEDEVIKYGTGVFPFPFRAGLKLSGARELFCSKAISSSIGPCASPNVT